MRRLYAVGIMLIMVVFILPAVLLGKPINTAGTVLLVFLAFLGMLFSGR